MLSILSWLILVLVPAQAAPSILEKRIHIATEPAPPPELGPPGAAHADRDPANLKYDIIAICGAYVGWTIVTILLIILVGRRLRRRAQSSNPSLQMVMMKSFPFIDPSPVSPRKSPNFSYPSPKSPGMVSGTKMWGRKSHKGNVSEYSISTVASYDEAHRARNMEELSELYAAVMAHDEEKHARQRVSTVTQSPDDYYTPVSPRVAPEFAHLYHTNQLSHPLAPTPVDQLPEDTHETQVSRSSSKTARTTPLSIISEISSKAGGLMSPKRPRRISIKDQRISQPMGSADLRDAHLYSDNVPLSPRHYNPGPPPLTPGQLRQQQQYQQQSKQAESSGEQILIHMQPQRERERRVPPALALSTANGSNASLHVDGSQTSLPSRAPKALPFREAYGDTSLRSAPPTKTTFLERPEKNYGPKSAMRTGVVPQTPYSPYMPFTPMTPITPRRLATREELKKQRKEERMKVLSENDLVSDEGWGA